MKKNFKTLLLTLAMAIVILPSLTVHAAPSIRELTPVEHALAENPLDRVFYFDTPTTYGINVDSDSIDVAGYQDWRFTWQSAPEFVSLQADCDTFTVYGTCEGDVADTLTINIIDVTHEGLYDTSLDFPADGSYTTFARALPKGLYKAYFTGDPNILKPHAMVVFSKFNTSFFSGADIEVSEK